MTNSDKMAPIYLSLVLTLMTANLVSTFLVSPATARHDSVGSLTKVPKKRDGTQILAGKRNRRGITRRELQQAKAVVSAEKNKMAQNASETEEDYADFEVITDEDRQAASQRLREELLAYAGYTLITVVVTVVLVIIFISDPRACILAFGTGSPCCLLCPWYRDLANYTDPAKLIRANVNIYVPGMYIQPDGVLKQYPPSPDEMDCLFDLVGEFMKVE